GPSVTRDELLAAVAQLGDASGVNLADALDGLPATEGARAAIASRLAVSTGHELDDQPPSILRGGAAGVGPFARHRIAGGRPALAVRRGRRAGGAARTRWGGAGGVGRGGRRGGGWAPRRRPRAGPRRPRRCRTGSRTRSTPCATGKRRSCSCLSTTRSSRAPP